MNRKYFGVHQHIEDRTIDLVYVGTDKNVSDYLTKDLFGNKFLRFRVDIMGSVENIKILSTGKNIKSIKLEM